jgi:hypothetical protein
MEFRARLARMRTSRLVGLVVLGLALAAPAAQASSPSPLCDPVGAQSAFSDAVTAAGGAAGRGSVREPDLGVHEDLPTSAKGKAGKRFSATVPVYFHVVTDGTTGALTQAQIDAQMTVLNRTFAGAEGGATSGFKFMLAGVTRTDNADWFYGVGGLGGVEEHDMKHSLHQGGPNALNLYSTAAGDYLGWAYFPNITTKPGQAYIDGVVFDWETIRARRRRTRAGTTRARP